MASLLRGSVFRQTAGQAFTGRWRCCVCVAPGAPSNLIAALRTHSTRQQRQLASRHLSSATTPSPAKVPRRIVPPSFAEQLARKGAPTQLYESSGYRMFRFAGFAAGTFCIMYAGYHYTSIILYPPPGLSAWTPAAYSAIIIFMGVIGAYFIGGLGGIVRSIRAVPGPAPVSKGFLAPSSRSVATNTSPVHFEFRISRVVPILPDKTLCVAPSQVVLPVRFTQLRSVTAALAAGLTGAGRSPTHRELMAAQAARDAKLKAEAEYDRSHLLTAPFRHFTRGGREVFKSFRRVFFQDGFVKISIDGKKKYKVDVHGGWALDDGRALDRLAIIERTDSSIPISVS